MDLYIILLAAYVVGSLPTAVIIARRVGHINIFEHGSGNPGASNVFRLLGPRWASATFGVDVLKGYLPVWLVSQFAGHLVHPVLAPTAIAVEAWVGFAAFLGHVYSPFLKFRGGKGAATGLGAMFALAPQTVTFLVVLYGLLLYLVKTFSVATLGASMAFPFVLYFFEGKHDPKAIAWGLIAPALLLFTHRKNIRRLFSGGELSMHEPIDKEEDEDHGEIRRTRRR